MHRSSNPCCLKSSFHPAHVGLLTIDGLPTTIPITENIGKYISADLFAILVTRHYHAVSDTDVAVEANVQPLETGLEIRRSWMLREPLDMLSFGKEVSRGNRMHEVGRENPIQRLRIISGEPHVLQIDQRLPIMLRRALLRRVPDNSLRRHKHDGRDGRNQQNDECRGNVFAIPKTLLSERHHSVRPFVFEVSFVLFHARRAHLRINVMPRFITNNHYKTL